MIKIWWLLISTKATKSELQRIKATLRDRQIIDVLLAECCKLTEMKAGTYIPEFVNLAGESVRGG